MWEQRRHVHDLIVSRVVYATEDDAAVSAEKTSNAREARWSYAIPAAASAWFTE
ncbi:hypothetical protein BN2537_2895 [Streptomyces venezuelae]|nr:hypothetical protein BN2537_2895 [Streptomyces venezuelae]